jgi:hypothetical protein
MPLKHLLGATLLASIACLAQPEPSHAATRVFIDGVGAATCSQVTADIKTNTEVVANSVLHWAYGYMTRRNIEQATRGQTQVDLSKNFDGERMLGIILAFCEKEPSARIFQVVDALYEVLLKEQSPTS